MADWIKYSDEFHGSSLDKCLWRLRNVKCQPVIFDSWRVQHTVLKDILWSFSSITQLLRCVTRNHHFSTQKCDLASPTAPARGSFRTSYYAPTGNFLRSIQRYYLRCLNIALSKMTAKKVRMTLGNSETLVTFSMSKNQVRSLIFRILTCFLTLYHRTLLVLIFDFCRRAIP